MSKTAQKNAENARRGGAAHNLFPKPAKYLAACLREYAIANNAARKFFERGLWVVI